MDISWSSMEYFMDFHEKFHEKFPEKFLKHPPFTTIFLTIVRAEPAPSRIVVDATLCPHRQRCAAVKAWRPYTTTSAASAALLVAPSDDWLSLSGEPSNYGTRRKANGQVFELGPSCCRPGSIMHKPPCLCKNDPGARAARGG